MAALALQAAPIGCRRQILCADEGTRSRSASCSATGFKSSWSPGLLGSPESDPSPQCRPALCFEIASYAERRKPARPRIDYVRGSAAKYLRACAPGGQPRAADDETPGTPGFHIAAPPATCSSSAPHREPRPRDESSPGYAGMGRLPSALRRPAQSRDSASTLGASGAGVARHKLQSSACGPARTAPPPLVPGSSPDPHPESNGASGSEAPRAARGPPGRPRSECSSARLRGVQSALWFVSRRECG